MITYPYPGDSPIARSRRIARAYREHLLRADPALCASLDDLCEQWGETWLVPRILRYDLDDWLSADQAADIAGIQPASLRKLRARGRLTGRRRGKTWEYLARDVLGLSIGPRRRGEVDESPS